MLSVCVFTGIFAVSTVLKKIALMAEEAFKDTISSFMTLFLHWLTL